MISCLIKLIHSYSLTVSFSIEKTRKMLVRMYNNMPLKKKRITMRLNFKQCRLTWQIENLYLKHREKLWIPKVRNRHLWSSESLRIRPNKAHFQWCCIILAKRKYCLGLIVVLEEWWFMNCHLIKISSHSATSIV